MKFKQITTKVSGIFAIATLASASWGLWSASLIPDVTTGITGYSPNNYPVISRIETPNRSKGILLTLSATSALAAVLLSISKDDQGDRLINRETLSDDIKETSQVLSNNLGCALEFVSGRGFKFLFGKQSVARTVAMSVLPVPIRDFIQEKVTNHNWFDQLLNESRHYVICGATGDGKSMLLFAIILAFIKRDNGAGRDRLAISDINYGKPDEHGNINTWMEIDRKIISVNINEIMATGRSIVAELRECREAGVKAAEALSRGDQAEHDRIKPSVRKGNTLWIIEELIATRLTLENADKKLLQEFDDIRQEIRLYGRGFGFKMCEILQYLNANHDGINLGQRQNICIILLKSMASSADTVKKVFSNHEELSARFREYLKRFKYLAMVQLGEGDPQILEIPDLSYVNQTSLRSPVDPVDTWLSNVWTEENQQWIAETIANGKSPLSSSPEIRAEFKSRFKIELSNDDARYVRLKEVINQQKQLVEA